MTRVNIIFNDESFIGWLHSGWWGRLQRPQLRYFLSPLSSRDAHQSNVQWHRETPWLSRITRLLKETQWLYSIPCPWERRCSSKSSTPEYGNRYQILFILSSWKIVRLCDLHTLFYIHENARNLSELQFYHSSSRNVQSCLTVPGGLFWPSRDHIPHTFSWKHKCQDTDFYSFHAVNHAGVQTFCCFIHLSIRRCLQAKLRLPSPFNYTYRGE